jgi:dienelactone hydrolase
MRSAFYVAALALATSFFASCNNSGSSATNNTTDSSAGSELKEENVTYSTDSVTMNGYIVYGDSVQGKRPAVLVVHEWWGLNDYAKSRARQLADLGYVAMAVDMYGNGQTASTPQEAGNLAGPFYQNPQLTEKRLNAAIAKLKTYPQVDTSKIAAIGYCYGGFVVLNAAKLGADLDAVVSFHGNLGGVKPNKDSLKAKLLVLHGEADPIVKPEEVAQFRKQMDSIGADYKFVSYPNAKHAFTNPAADSVENKFHIGVGYNAEAAEKSWEEMKQFLRNVFNR